jgi:hypothetical protein
MSDAASFVSSSSQMKTTTNTFDSNWMDRLPMDVFQNSILTFVGDHQFRFVAAVNSKFYHAYTSLYPHRTTYRNVCTMEHAKICFHEINSSNRNGDDLRRIDAERIGPRI